MTWKDQLNNAITTTDQLREYLHLTSEEIAQYDELIERHPMSIPPYYLSLIDPDDPADPIRRMSVPSSEEFDLSGSYDTSGESDNTKMPGLQHKYAQTALILSTNQCAMYCRHCFRKRLVGLPNNELLQRFDDAARYVSEHREINNVLITGGDPLVLSTDVIERFLEMLAPIDHLSFIRFGSRIPVTLPMRITEDTALQELFRANSRPDRRLYLVTQFNHPREITPEVRACVDTLISCGVIVNNQTVLLHGVNDDPETLALLQNRLVSVGINPYYVFQCRPVKRVKHHFQVPLKQGYACVESARRLLNGHSKRFRYIMSHVSGKIEIVGVRDDEMFFKYHQAKNPADMGRFFSRPLNDSAGWLDELPSPRQCIQYAS